MTLNEGNVNDHEQIVPTDGLVITEDARFRPGVYLLPRGVSIAADGVTVDGNGAVLVGVDGKGQGITIHGQTGVTVRHVRLRDYYHGVYARQCRDLTIEACQISGTSEIPANTIFLDIWRAAEEAYGGGLLLWRVTDSLVQDNDLQHQMNGLLSYDCRNLTVRNNLSNYCSGFGFHLYQTCDSLFADNFADFCCRFQPRSNGAGHMGADSAGFVIVYSSCGNVFRGNSSRLSGDGFFLAGMAPESVHVGCDENLFEANDGSYSPNIAFEATFSRANIFRDNRANFCNYGFWLGFSRDNLLEKNQIWRNRQAGIAVENGHGMTVQRNDIRANGHGILLWSKYVEAFASSVPGNDTSRDWMIAHNQFVENDKGIRIAADQDHGVRPIPLERATTPRPRNHKIIGNIFQRGRIGIELLGVDDTMLSDNRFFDVVTAEVNEA